MYIGMRGIGGEGTCFDLGLMVLFFLQRRGLLKSRSRVRDAFRMSNLMKRVDQF